MNIGIISISSDIGHALATHWRSKGATIAGTYRTASPKTLELENLGVSMIPCDLYDSMSVRAACAQLAELTTPWDVLVLCPATLEPIGDFADCDFDAWERSFNLNFTEQMRCIHALLPFRNHDDPNGPCVISWSGGGTNSAPKAFSAYTASKIAQIKMMELLDAEIPGVRFVILGPGWVRTKIHQETMKSGQRAGDAFDRTAKRLSGEAGWTEMSGVVACCDWILTGEKVVVGGRNFSVQHDAWGNALLESALAADPDMYKLRRNRNDWRSPD